jgi:hypothetical protein
MVTFVVWMVAPSFGATAIRPNSISGVGVEVAVGVLLAVGVAVGVRVGVLLGLGVGVGVTVGVLLAVGVAVGV